MAFFEVNKKTFLKFPFRKKGTVFFGLLLIGLAAVCFPPVSLMAMGLVATIAASVGFVVLGTLFILSLLKWILKPSFQNLDSEALQLPPVEEREKQKEVNDLIAINTELNKIIKSFTYFVTVSRDLEFFLTGAMKRMEKEKATVRAICDEIGEALEIVNQDDRFEELCFICRIAACRVDRHEVKNSVSAPKISEEFLRWWRSMWQEERTSYEESSNGKKYESDEIFRGDSYTYALFKTDDPYEVLGLEEDATVEQINKAFRAAMIKNHPDKGGDKGKAQDVVGAYQKIGEKLSKSEPNYPHRRGEETEEGEPQGVSRMSKASWGWDISGKKWIERFEVSTSSSFAGTSVGDSSQQEAAPPAGCG